MWWEYLIVFVCLGMAVSYVLWVVLRAFGGRAAGCGSGACHCGASSRQGEDGSGLKVTHPVQIRVAGKKR